MKIKSKWLILAGLVVVAGLFAAFGLNHNTQAQHFTAKVERGEIHDVVEATADLETAKANLAAARANLAKSKAALVQTKADYDRAVGLTKGGIDSQQQLDLAKANYDSANASVDAAAASVTQAQAQVSQKEAAVTVSQTNFNYTVIRSPIDGTVVARNVDVGQTVAASLQAPTIFTIAQDLTKMLVYAKTDESDVGNIRPGKPVTFKVDAFPKDTFHGVVSQVRMNPTTVQSVVTYDTIIEFANPELKLFPGMTAYVTIPVATAQNVLKLPNTALRYKPPLSQEEILALYKQYGIEAGEKKRANEDSAAPERSAPAGGGQNQPRTPRSDAAVVWKLHADNTLEPVKVSLGITDHSYTEITTLLKGEVKEGDELIIRSVTTKTATPGGPGIRR